MDRKTSLIFAIVISIAMSSNTTNTWSHEGELRDWWSHDGAESIRASFVRFDKKSDIVSLKDESGEQVDVKITLLSRADRRYVARAFKKSLNSRDESSVFKIRKSTTTEDNEPEILNPKNDPDPSKVFRRYGINWTEGIDNALASAIEVRKKQPVMWFRVLGDLKGLM